MLNNTRIIVKIAKIRFKPFDNTALVMLNAIKLIPIAMLMFTSHPRLTPKIRKTSEISHIISKPIRNAMKVIPSFIRVGIMYFFFLLKIDLEHNNIISDNPVRMNKLIGSHPFIRLIDSSAFIIL